MRETVEYIVTDFDGTFTNTADLFSGSCARSSDSPVLEALIRDRPNLAGVIGCTHRATAAPKDELKNQKIAAIEGRL